MKDEYDFAGVEPGRFLRAGAELVLPIHLDAEVLAFLAPPRAAARDLSLSEYVKRLLRQDIEIIQAAE